MSSADNPHYVELASTIEWRLAALQSSFNLSDEASEAFLSISDDPNELPNMTAWIAQQCLDAIWPEIEKLQHDAEYYKRLYFDDEETE